MKIFILIKRLGRLCIVFPIVVFALLMCKVSGFTNTAIFVSQIPFNAGNLIRYYFYKYTLLEFGRNVTINFGSILSYKSSKIGNNVWIGVGNVFGEVDIKDNVITAQGCHFVSGKYGHTIGVTSIPIMEQGGVKQEISIGPDVWFGANCTTLANVGRGCVIGAGSVIVKDIPDFSIAVGNPCRVIKTRI